MHRRQEPERRHAQLDRGQGGDGGVLGRLDRHASGVRRHLPGAQHGQADRDHRRGGRGPASAEDRAERGAWAGCIAGALSRSEYEAGLAAAGFQQVSVAFTHQVGDGLHSAIIKATEPSDADPATTATAPANRTMLPMASDSGCC